MVEPGALRSADRGGSGALLIQGKTRAQTGDHPDFSTVTEPHFRVADPADAPRLAELMARTFRETYDEAHGGVCRTADVDAYVAGHFGAERQAREIADAAMRTIVAEVDGALAGYAQLRYGAPTPARDGPRPVEIARFYVDRPWQGRGVAQALMRAAVDAAAGADPLWLGVFQRNVRACAFYARQGFVRAGTATFVMGDDVQDDWILVYDPATPLP